MLKQSESPYVWRYEMVVRCGEPRPKKRARTALLSARERGQGMAEYALILLLLAIAVIITLPFVGHQIGLVFDKVVAALDDDTATVVLAVTDVQRSSNRRRHGLNIEYMLEDDGGITAYFLVEDFQNGSSRAFRHRPNRCGPVTCAMYVGAALGAGQMSMTPFNHAPSSGGEPIGDTVTFHYPAQ